MGGPQCPRYGRGAERCPWARPRLEQGQAGKWYPNWGEKVGNGSISIQLGPSQWIHSVWPGHLPPPESSARSPTFYLALVK